MTRASTRARALTAEHLPSAQLLSSPPSSPAGLVDPYALPDDLLTPFLDVVPRVSSDPISAGATGDEVLAPIYRIDKVVATLTVGFVLAAAKVQRVVAAPSVDAVSPTVAVDSITIRGAPKVIGSVIALDHCG